MRLKVSINKREALATGLLCLLGLVAALQVSASSVARIAGLGTGALPVVLGALMMLLGVLWVFDSRLSPDDDDGVDIGVSKWRGISGVTSGVFAFLMLIRYAGFLPAMWVSAFIVIMGDRRHSWRSASVLASTTTTLAVVILSFIPSVSLDWFIWG